MVKEAVSKIPSVSLTTVRSGYDALVEYVGSKPDLLIIDCCLKDFSWTAALESLRKCGGLSGTLILGLYGRSSHEADSGFPPPAVLDGLLSKESLDSDMILKAVTGLLKVSVEPHGENTTYNHTRLWPRYPVNIPASLELYRVSAPDDRQGGQALLENISYGGAYLSRINISGGQLPGDAFRIHLEINSFPLDNWRSECGIVRIHIDSALGAGIRFLDLTPDDREKIAVLAPDISSNQ